jgi:cytochrome c-type biogenesis protein CcmF
VEASFYDATNLPIAVIITLLIGYSLFMQWEVHDGLYTIRRSLTSLGAAALSCIVLLFAGVRDAGALLLIFTSLFALYVNVRIGAGVARADWRSLGGKIAHVGIALLLIGVIVTGRFSSKEHVSLPQYTPRTVLGRSMTYTGYTQLPDGKIVFNIRVVSPGESFRLSPGMSPGGDQGVLRTPDIASFLMHDIYVSPIGVETANAAGASTNAVAGPESLVIDASIKPCINLLWGGTLVMMAGFVLAFVKRSKES